VVGEEVVTKVIQGGTRIPTGIRIPTVIGIMIIPTLSPNLLLVLTTVLLIQRLVAISLGNKSIVTDVAN